MPFLRDAAREHLRRLVGVALDRARRHEAQPVADALDALRALCAAAEERRLRCGRSLSRLGEQMLFDRITAARAAAGRSGLVLAAELDELPLASAARAWCSIEHISREARAGWMPEAEALAAAEYELDELLDDDEGELAVTEGETADWVTKAAAVARVWRAELPAADHGEEPPCMSPPVTMPVTASAARYLEAQAPTLMALAHVPRWVAWQTEKRKELLTKVPYRALHPRERAKADAPATWDTREKAEMTELPRPFGSGGVGIMLGDHFGLAIGGVDLDTCRAGPDAALAPWAAEVVERLGSYTETSPSGTGAKVLFTFDAADFPTLQEAMGTKGGKMFKRPGGAHPPAIELHLSNRYFAVTDQHLDGTPAELRHVTTDTLLWLIHDAGPAFAKGEAGERSAPASTRRATRRASASTDNSRSARAFRMACKIKRAGGTDGDVIEALEADPAAAEWLAEKGQADQGRELRRLLDRATPDPNEIELTEDGVALAFEAEHRDALRYCHQTGGWYEWTGSRWKPNRDKLAFDWARTLARKLNRTADFKTKAITGKASFAAAVERFAQAHRTFAVTAEVWDRDPFLLGTPGGTVDLRTGALWPAAREDHITKAAAVAPAMTATCPTWLAFLKQATADDAGLIRFLQQWCGYCLTGSTREHALMFIYGPGGNGKSVFLNTVAGILADYVASAAMDTFTASPSDKHPTDLAMLRGARLVTATETEEGRAWAEARIKQMTGGDPITARFMRQDFFTYTPAFKLTIAGNHKPALKNVDDAARRRFNIVPFLHKPERPDHQLERKLEAEWPGILRWMIDGCLDWQHNGLMRPAIVTDATAEYFEAQDVIGRWLAERCILAPHLEIKPGILLNDLRTWAAANGETPPTPQQFRSAIEKVKGVRYVMVKGVRTVKGIGRQAEPDRRQGDEHTGEG